MRSWPNRLGAGERHLARQPGLGPKIGYSRERLAQLNRRSISMLEEVRSRYESAQSPMVISGCIGPRGDGYQPGALMSERQAEDYHAWQVSVFRDTAADMVAAITMTNAELDASTELDDGDPVEFGHQHGELRHAFPHMTVLGGCCGTDHRHIEQIELNCRAA